MIDRNTAFSESAADECAAELSQLLQSAEDPSEGVQPLDWIVLARYGLVPQVARFGGTGPVPARDAEIVVTTERGTELAVVLQPLKVRGPLTEAAEQLTGRMLRLLSAEDRAAVQQRRSADEQAFASWLQRAETWKLQLQIVDLEHTMDDRLILYVLNDRGPETTRLALLAAAAGCGIVHVQPVSAEGLVPEKSGGGCG
ncbi:MAG: hypothetical protein ACKO3T_14970, partial [Planctomycetaceae bacterium]